MTAETAGGEDAAPRRRPPALLVLLQAHWVLAVAVALGSWLSFLGFFTAYNQDEAVYSIVARGMVHGHWPYRDLFDHKPPLIYVWYLPVALGASLEAERVLAALTMAASLLVLAVVARRLLPPHQVPLAVGAYALLMASPFLAVKANVEAFILLPLLGAVAVGSPFVAGILFGVALATKPAALAFAPLMIALWWRRPIALIAGAALVLLAVSAPFLPIWREYTDANVAFNFDYGRYADGASFSRLFQLQLAIGLAGFPIWIAVVAGALAQRRRLLWLWGACGWVSVKAAGFEFPHYYALLMPPAALLAAPGLELLWRRRSLRALSIMAGIVAVVVFAAGSYFSVAHGRQYPGVSEALRRDQGEFYVLGGRAEFYLIAGRWPTRRFFFSTPLVVRSYWGEQARQGLAACPPDVLVVPDMSVFAIPWRQAVEDEYREHHGFEGGTVFSAPYTSCGDTGYRSN